MTTLNAREEHYPFEKLIERCNKKLVPGKGLQEEQQNEVVKSNFLHTLHLNDLIGPII